MPRSVTFRATLAAVVCATSLSVYAASHSTKKVEIPAGELRPALLQLSKTLGVEILYQPSQLDHFHTAGVRGSYTPEEAVRLLLKGTPLELRTDPSGAMIVIDPKAPRATAVSALNEQVSPTPSGENGLQSGSALRPAPASGDSVESQQEQANSSAASIEEVLVTAQKREERLQDVPVPVSAISTDALIEN